MPGCAHAAFARALYTTLHHPVLCCQGRDMHRSGRGGAQLASEGCAVEAPVETTRVAACWSGAQSYSLVLQRLH
jgi:hypothetical protein